MVNPYQSPAETETPVETQRDESGFWRVCYWSGVGFGVFGFLAIFLRNLPPLGFVLVAIVLLTISVVGSKKYRKRSIVGLFVCLMLGVGCIVQWRLLQARIAVERSMQANEAARAAAQIARAIAESKNQTDIDSTTDE